MMKINTVPKQPPPSFFAPQPATKARNSLLKLIDSSWPPVAWGAGPFPRLEIHAANAGVVCKRLPHRSAKQKSRVTPRFPERSIRAGRSVRTGGRSGHRRPVRASAAGPGPAVGPGIGPVGEPRSLPTSAAGWDSDGCGDIDGRLGTRRDWSGDSTEGPGTRHRLPKPDGGARQPAARLMPSRSGQ